MIVVDTNLILYFYMNGAHSRSAEKAFAKDPQWTAPLLWRSEFRNVLATCLRRSAMDFETAVSIQDEAERLMDGSEFSVPSTDVLRIAAGSGCSAYDCEFVALARYLEVPLVTADRALLRAFPDTAVHPDAFGR